MRRIGFWAAAAMAWAMAAGGATQVVDLRTEGGAVRRGSDGFGAACLRSTSLSAGAAAAERLSPGDTVEFRLFRDEEIRVKIGERMESPLGGDAFLGEVEGGGGAKNAVVLQTAEGLTVDIQDYLRGRVYTIVSDAEGVAVREFDPSRETVVPTAGVVPACAEEKDAVAGRGAGARAAGDQASTVLDVLVAYDKPAEEWARRNGGGTTNFATMAVQKMNTALETNGLASSFRLRLVGVETVAAEGGADFDWVLDATREGTGAWAAVKAKRDEVGADVVTTMIDTGSASGVTGLGYSLERTPVSGFSESAYNVCAVRAVAQSHTMTHETGHNLGAGHASAVDPSQISSGPQLFDYSAGHHFKGTNGVAYHTIMAYYYDGFGNTYTPAPFFSSPDCTYMGTAVGDATHDNARTLRETYAAASQWRAQKVPLSYDVFFSPGGGATFTNSIEVTLAPGKAGLPIRYTLDGSAPTLSSPLYAGPLTFTDTTTIRAATVTDGVLGPVFEATYSLSDLGNGLDAPQLAWSTSESRPWVFQTSDTHDGVDAVQSSDLGGYWSDDAWLETTVSGPTDMSFRYKLRTYLGTFSVLVDGGEVFADRRDVSHDDWHLAEISIPAGTHRVRFLFDCDWGRYSGFNGAWLDTVRFDALSRPPAVSPATTPDEADATVFQGSLAVTLFPPEGATGTIYYTLDGSDPAGESQIPYEGPIVLSESTRVRAVFVEGGKEPSVEVGGLYLERHPVAAGEWTTDVEGVKAAAAKDGRLIAVLCADLSGCYWSQRFNPVAESPEFLAWAAANGVYLVSADESRHVDAGAADAWFGRLYRSYGDSGYIYYPTLYFARPDAPEAAIGKGLARNDENDSDAHICGVRYLDTAESLIAGFAAALGETVPQVPVCSATDSLVDAFPVSVALSNPNGSGIIRYTLDGTAPTRTNGLVYGGAIEISDASAVLQAVVWPDSGVSSPVFVGAYKRVEDVLGTKGVAWSRSGSGTWREDDSSPATLRAGGLRDAAFEATLRATVSGKGKLVFTYRFETWTSQNTFSFAVDGTPQWTKVSDASGTVTNEVAAEGKTTFEWTHTVGNPSCDYSAAGVWLSGVRWIPEGGDVVVEGVAVSREWLDRHYPGQGGNAEEYRALAEADSDSDGYAAWQEFLLGTDPTNAASRLSVRVGVGADGTPVFGWTPTNGAIQSLGFRYVPLGRTTMNDEEGWRPGVEGEHAFFAVSVEPDE